MILQSLRNKLDRVLIMLDEIFGSKRSLAFMTGTLVTIATNSIKVNPQTYETHIQYVLYLVIAFMVFLLYRRSDKKEMEKKK